MIELKKKQKVVDLNKLNRATATKFANEIIELVEKKEVSLEQQIVILRRAVKMKLAKRRK